MYADVLIAGAGPAALACAIEARLRGLSVAWTAPLQCAATPQMGEALSAEGRLELLRLQLEQALDPAHIPEVRAFVHWGQPGVAVGSHNLEPYGAPRHLDKAAFVASLAEEAGRKGCVQLPGRILSFEQRATEWTTSMTGGVTVRSQYLIDATGRKSVIGRRLSARTSRQDRLVASAMVTPNCGIAQRLTEATPLGWWSCTTHPKLGTTLVFFTDNDLRRPDAEFQELIGHSRFVRHFAGRIEGPPRLVHMDACTAMLCPAAGPGWRAIGDAAISYDPLSSDGICNAFRTARWAAESLGVAGGHRGYQEALLRHFRQYRNSHRLVYIAAGFGQHEFWRRRQPLAMT